MESDQKIMSSVMPKIKDAYREGGLSNLACKIFWFPFRFAWYKMGVQKAWGKERYIFGKIVELRGNNVRYKDLIISLDNPLIPTLKKSSFLFGLGSYEKYGIIYANKYLDRSLPLIGLGACMGVVACITDRLIPGKHIVVEANPKMIPLLQKNRDSNKCKFTIINKAIGYTGTVDFYINDNFVACGIHEPTAQKITVPTVTLAEVSKDFDRFNLIVDIEGEEIELIDREIDILRKKVAVLIIEFHRDLVGKEKTSRIIKKLESAGFRCMEQFRDDAVFINTFFAK